MTVIKTGQIIGTIGMNFEEWSDRIAENLPRRFTIASAEKDGTTRKLHVFMETSDILVGPADYIEIRAGFEEEDHITPAEAVDVICAIGYDSLGNKVFEEGWKWKV